LPPPILSSSTPVFIMRRNTRQLQHCQFDLTVVGGGIHGATLALAAVRAGYRVALLEKGDFGHATSANSLKIIHGGIRYLQHGDVRRMRESIVSRRRMMTFAPHLVKPLACLMPTYGHGLKGREMMRLAFALYDLIAVDRNHGLSAENWLPRGTSLGRDEVGVVLPGIARQGLTGGAVWYDAIALNTERLVLEYIKEAVRYGAVVANYAEVTAVATAGDKVSGVMAADLMTGQEIRVACRTVVSAAGPWLERLAGGGRSAPAAQLWTTAVNVVVKKRLFQQYAVGLEGYTDFTDKDALIKRGKRLFFFVPWQERYTMIGTAYAPYHGAVDDFSLSREEVAKMLDDINKILPTGQLTMADVTMVHGGLLPISEADGGTADSVQLDKSSLIIDHGSEAGINGLFSIKGVKYTTAPDIAEKMVGMLAKDKWLGGRVPGSYAAARPRRLDLGPLIGRLGPEYEIIRSHLVSRYATRWREIFSYLAASDSLTANASPLWLCTEPPLLTAELLYFICEEMAVTLADVVFRRCGLASAECPERDILARVAGIMGGELGWSEAEEERQLAEALQVFAYLHG
jgi:glycerol-3-phosphate dehydrogenase